MPDFRPLIEWLESQPDFRLWAEELPQRIAHGLAVARWGDLPQWQAVLDGLPQVLPSSVDFNRNAQIGKAADLSPHEQRRLATTLMGLHPWRKGPWHLFGVDIDTEWRSDWKWDRLAPHIDVRGHRVLDVGCGNGYHCARLYGAGAERVIGIDPSAKFVFQFQVFKTYCPAIPVDVLPLGIEQIPSGLKAFDTVLSMGVLYHRREPLAHLRELADCLKPGGQLVLETLVVEGSKPLIPQGRYAKMRNVWCVPSPQQVLEWLAAAGFSRPRVVDLTTTTVEEQRSTPWMHFESLADFLDPGDPSLTIEGYPAPRRGMFLAHL